MRTVHHFLLVAAATVATVPAHPAMKRGSGMRHAFAIAGMDRNHEAGIDAGTGPAFGNGVGTKAA